MLANKASDVVNIIEKNAAMAVLFSCLYVTKIKLIINEFISYFLLQC